MSELGLLERVNKALGKNVKFLSLFETVEELLVTIEQYELHENLLIAQNKKFQLEIKELKKNSRLIKFYEMAEENLELAQEVAKLKGVLPV